VFVLFYEEPTLREKFGAEYQDYCRRVSRWVPHVPRSKSAASV
jgi:protein-S-isoprenylcysteine O-methyltransferase Ste14